MKYKTFALVLPVVFCLTALVAVPRLQEQTGTSKSSLRQSRRVDVTQFPVIEFSASETKDIRRKTRNEKRNKSRFRVDPDALSDNTVIVDSVDLSLPAFPTEQAAAVVIGTITDAQAHLSNDRTGIYSVFALSIEEVLKNPGNLTVGKSLEAEREGGRVKFSSERVHVYQISEQDMPRVSRRYALFLAPTNVENVFELITGYEIREDSVYPLDELPQSRSYENMVPTNFLNELRMKLARR